MDFRGLHGEKTGVENWSEIALSEYLKVVRVA